MFVAVTLVVCPLARSEGNAPQTVPVPNDPRIGLMKVLWDGITFSDQVDPASASSAFFVAAFASAVWWVWSMPNMHSDSNIARGNLEARPYDAEYLARIRVALENLRRDRPELFRQLRESATRYEDVLREANDLVSELKHHPSRSNRQFAVAADRAIEAWSKNMDMTEAEALARDFPKLVNHKNWNARLRAWSTSERAANAPILEAATTVVTLVNEGRAMDAQLGLPTTDRDGRHRPNRFTFAGRDMSPSQLVGALHNVCIEALGAFPKKMAELQNSQSLLVNGYRRYASWIAGGLTLFFGGMSGYYGIRTYRATGKDPDTVRNENAHRSAVDSQVKMRTEASPEGQFMARKSDLKPLTDLLTDVLEAHEKDIFTPIDEYLKKNPELLKKNAKLPGEIASRRALFQKQKDPAQEAGRRERLAQKFIEALGATSDKRFSGTSTDHILMILKQEPKDADARAKQSRLLNGVYTHLIDAIFPELENVRPVSGPPIPQNASDIVGAAVRNTLVDEVVPRLPQLHIAIREVPAHPAAPTDPPPPPVLQPPAKGGAALPVPEKNVGMAPPPRAVAPGRETVSAKAAGTPPPVVPVLRPMPGPSSLTP